MYLVELIYNYSIFSLYSFNSVRLVQASKIVGANVQNVKEKKSIEIRIQDINYRICSESFLFERLKINCSSASCCRCVVHFFTPVTSRNESYLGETSPIYQISF